MIVYIDYMYVYKVTLSSNQETVEGNTLSSKFKSKIISL